MAGEKHLRLSVFGDYDTTGVPASEVWSFNLRLALVFGAVDDLGAFPSNWDVTPDFDTNVDTTWTTQRTYLVDGPAAATFDPSSYLIDQAQPALSTYISGWKFSPKVRLQGMSLYPCDSPDGTSIGGNFARLDYTSGWPVGGGSNLMPLENSVVVSWQTNRLGPRGRGRIYTPPPGTNVLDADGLLSSGNRNDLLRASAQLLLDLAYTSPTPGGPLVRPVVTGPTAKPGQPAYSQYALIKGVRVGRVIDTQRRRRNAEVEDYASVTVTY